MPPPPLATPLTIIITLTTTLFLDRVPQQWRRLLFVTGDSGGSKITFVMEGGTFHRVALNK